MPAWVKDEALWERAKGLVRGQYADVDEDSERFWRLVTGVYKHAGGVMAKSFRVACPACKHVAVDVNDEGALILKSRCLEAAAEGGLSYRCRCKALNPLPAEVVGALLSRPTRLFMRSRGTTLDTETEPRSS